MSFSIPFPFPFFCGFPSILFFSVIFVHFFSNLCLSLPAFTLARLRFGSQTRSSGATASGVQRVELGREAELGQPEVIKLGVDRVDTVAAERSKNSRSFRSLGASLT